MLGNKLLIPLLVFALLLGAAAARAAPAGPTPAPVGSEKGIEAEDEDEGEDEEAGEAERAGEFEAELLGEFSSEEEEEEALGVEEEESPEEECEEATEEFEEGEIDREELEEDCKRQRQRSQSGPGQVLPEVCVMRSFDSSAVADPGKSTVALTVRYTTFEPTKATIAYDTRGVRIDTAKRHLGARGTLRLHRRIGVAGMRRLKSSHLLDVQIGIPSTPASCQRYYDDSARVRLR
jgi:hypothetical protein